MYFVCPSKRRSDWSFQKKMTNDGQQLFLALMFLSYNNSSIVQVVLAGIVEQDVGVSLLLDMFSSLLSADEEGHPYLSVVLSFARHFAEDVAGIWPRKQRVLLDKFSIQLPTSKVRAAV